ncbi:MAG: hypothetical protein QNJ78_05895 [Gammaproteobacteria bacterium]|nr:hypothetical protein [Gammaproteobacteria bacterium]
MNEQTPVRDRAGIANIHSGRADHSIVGCLDDRPALHPLKTVRNEPCGLCPIFVSNPGYLDFEKGSQAGEEIKEADNTAR